MDKDKTPRDQANKTLNIYLTRVRKAAEEMPDTDPLAKPAAGAQGQAGSTSAQPVPDSSSWTGWALSSLASKAVSTPTDIRPETPKANGIIKPASSVASRNETPEVSRAPSPLFGTTNMSNQNDADGFGADGWGQDAADDWGFGESKQTEADNSTVNADGEPDFGAWLAAKKAGTQAAKPALPKGIGPRTTSKTANGANARPIVSRGASSVSSTARKVVAPPKPAPKKEEPAAEEEDWGSAWD